MAEIEIHGMDELIDAFFALEEVPDEITQDMLTEIIGSYVRDKDTDERRRLTKEVKRMNNGSADYKHIADPNVRREIYNYFWNLGNFQQERTA